MNDGLAEGFYLILKLESSFVYKEIRWVSALVMEKVTMNGRFDRGWRVDGSLAASRPVGSDLIPTI